jgi:GTPase SAR1 family protein
MLVYDVSSRESFDNVRRWLEEIRQKRDCDAEEATAFADEVI